MNASNNGYLLIFQGTDWYQGLLPGQMQPVFDRWMKRFSQLKSEGRSIAGNSLDPQGRIVSGADGRVVSDRPFAESKETIGGYFWLNVAIPDEAVATEMRAETQFAHAGTVTPPSTLHQN